MVARRLSDLLLGWFRRRPAEDHAGPVRRRGPLDHVIILDGTMSSLRDGEESNAGLTFKLLREIGHASVYYEAGVQWRGLRHAGDVIVGRGINRQIKRAYGYLASRYRPGDRIFLLGYSRGAYAVRSLAGVIDRIGLLRDEHATVRHVRQVYRHYQFGPDRSAARNFARAYCHEGTQIEMVGVWDTVKALGLRLPLLWRLIPPDHEFHSDGLGPSIKRGFHALARDETRLAFRPSLWVTPEDHPGRVEQVWFPGAHGDVGGQLGQRSEARPLANIPLVWMLGNLQDCGVDLPNGWRMRFPCDPAARSCGTWSGVGKLFLLRARRRIGVDGSERLYDARGHDDKPVTPGAEPAL